MKSIDDDDERNVDYFSPLESDLSCQFFGPQKEHGEGVRI